MFGRGKHLTAIAAISMEGVLDVTLVEGGVDSGIFQDFVHEKLTPKLQPFIGVNAHSVVIMGNASIHHVLDITQTFEGVYILSPTI